MSKRMYRVIETRPATAYWVYEVEAESEEEAMELTKLPPSTDHFTTIDWFVDAEFKCEEINITTT
jgi:hypothetical protein